MSNPKSKLRDLANGFRPKPREVYEAEPVNLPPPPPTHESVRKFIISKPRDVVGEYKKQNAIHWSRAHSARYRRVTHR